MALAQRQLLIDTFMQKKQDGLLRELEKQPRLGRFNPASHRLPRTDEPAPHA
jgi:hypothetical protein